MRARTWINLNSRPRICWRTPITITASAEEHGIITPSGAVSVEEGDSQTFTMTADRGYEVADVLVDGQSAGAVSSYTFEDVAGDHTNVVSFRAMDHYGENNPVVLNQDVTPDHVEAELLEFGGEGALVEENSYASGGKAVGWLGNCGDPWQRMAEPLGGGSRGWRL